MKLTKQMNELLNSGLTLTPTEVALVEEFIEKKSKPVKPQHLNHYKCVSSVRGVGSCSSYAERMRFQNTGV